MTETPASIEAEQAFLGAAILNQGVVDASGLQGKHFHEGLHQKIFEAILALRTAALPVNVVTLIQELADTELPPEITEAGFTIPAYLARLISSSMGEQAALGCAQVIVELWRRREVIQTAQAVIDESKKAEISAPHAETAMAAAIRDFSDLQTTIGGAQTGLGVFAHDFKDRPSREWLIKGVIPTKTFSLWIGPPGCGKSFLLLDYAMTTALAAVGKLSPEWFDRRIRPCGIAYLYAEGREDFEIRVDAFFQAMNMERCEFPLFVIPTAVDLCSTDEGVARLMAELRRAAAYFQARFGVELGALVIDTVNRCLGGQDENLSSTMGSFLGKCGMIQQQLGIGILAVHHMPAGAEKARGHGALFGGSDAQIIVSGATPEAPNRWRVTRSKVGPKGAMHEFRLRQQVVGKDKEGEDETSLVVFPMGSAPSMEEAAAVDAAMTAQTRTAHTTPDGRAILRDNLFLAFKSLAEAITRKGGEPPVGTRAPHGARVVTTTEWLDEMVRLFPGEDREGQAFRKRCTKARERAEALLLRRKLIGLDNGHFWRTDRKVLGIDDVSTKEPETTPKDKTTSPASSGPSPEKPKESPLEKSATLF